MSEDTKLKRRNVMTAATALAVVGVMIGFAYASSPLFSIVCRILGINGATQIATEAPRVISDVPVTVRFDSNTDPALPWEFKPDQKSVTLKMGETATVTYHAKNLSNRAIAGTATFNVTPEKIGIYFNKMGCFCFQETVLQPGEQLSLPVTFFVDPEMLKDERANEVRTVTLSYTFFPSANGVPVESEAKSASLIKPAAAADTLQ